MKNKTRCLSLLLFVPLLAGCGNKVSEPKFARYGDEVKASAFEKAFTKKLEAASFSKKAKIGSMELVSKTGEAQYTERTRDGKKFSTSESTLSIDTTMKYDADNLIVLNETEYVAGGTTENPGQTVDGEMKISSKTQMQQAKVKKQNYFVEADAVEEVYEPLMAVSKKDDLVTTLDAQAKAYASAGALQMMSVIMGYESAPEEEQKHYKFYQNGDIFTIEQKSEDTEKEAEFTAKRESRETMQCDFTEGKWSLKGYSEAVTTTTFKKDSGSYYKGEVLVEKQIAALELRTTKKSVKLEALDLSKYEAKGF